MGTPETIELNSNSVGVTSRERKDLMHRPDPDRAVVADIVRREDTF